MAEKKIVCNACGKEYRTQGEVIKKDFLCIQKDWGYFSSKDGQHHQIILCENCYDEWIRTFAVPPVVTDTKELI